MYSTAPIYLVWNVIAEHPKCTYMLPTFLSLCTLRTLWLCLVAKGVTIQRPGRVYRDYADL